MPPIKVISRNPSAADAAANLSALLTTAGAHEGGIMGLISELTNDPTGKWLSKFHTEDPAMLEVKRRIARLAAVDDPVLITGPSGTGKELLAHALHGKRPPNKFYSINCAAMPETLIESELFGHKSGSFTGAKYDNLGMFRAAEGGTVFLDEIGDAPAHLQAKLLRALQPAADGKRYVRPVGDTQQYEIHARVIGATKRNLLDMVSKQTFREDLYGRLMTFEVATTPLMQRTMDVAVILKQLGCTDPDAANKILSHHYWSGAINTFNVRALQAYVRRCQVLGSAD